MLTRSKSGPLMKAQQNSIPIPDDPLLEVKKRVGQRRRAQGSPYLGSSSARAHTRLPRIRAGRGWNRARSTVTSSHPGDIRGCLVTELIELIVAWRRCQLHLSSGARRSSHSDRLRILSGLASAITLERTREILHSRVGICEMSEKRVSRSSRLSPSAKAPRIQMSP